MNIIKVKTTELRSGLSVNAPTIAVRKFIDSNDTPLELADFGTFFVVVIKQGDKTEIIRCNGITQNVDGTADLTVEPSWRNVPPQPPFAGAATGKSFETGAEVIVSNDPYTMSFMLQVESAGVQTVVSDVRFPTPTNGANAATKDYADGLVASGAPIASQTTRGISMLAESPEIPVGDFTVTIATPAVFTLTAHGLQVGDTVKFATTGALPTGLAVGTDYYVIAAGLTANDFQISATLNGAAIDTSGVQNGVHSLTRTTPYVVTTENPLLPTQDEKDAAAGGDAHGTPNTNNKFVTEEYLKANGGGGDGSDGALNVGDGATVTLNTGQIYNYTTIDVHANGTLNFNRANSDDWVIIRATGNVDIQGTINTKGLVLDVRSDVLIFSHALACGTPMVGLGLGGAAEGGAGKGGDDGTTAPSTGAGGAGVSGNGNGNPGENGNGTTLGGGGGSGDVTEGGSSLSGGAASGKNGGDGSAGSGDNSDGGGGGAGVDDGNGGNGGSGSSRSGGRGGNGGNSGKNGGNGGNGGTGRTAGDGGHGYTNGGNGGNGNGFNIAGYGGRGGDGGEQGGNGGTGEDDGGTGGRGGNGTGGAAAFYLYTEGDLSFTGTYNGYGGNGGKGGNANDVSTQGDGGDGGDGGDVFMFCEGTLTKTGTVNNYGGRGGRHGEYIDVSVPANNRYGNHGRDGKNGRTIIAKAAI